jgi:hypothetical protein
VTGNRFVHFGGSGRGAGWAGLIEVSSDDEAPLAQALTTRRPVRLAYGDKELVFGPYYASSAALVPVTNDVVVVLGGDADELRGITDEGLQAAALVAADAVEAVTPAKRLADELEELEAVRSAVAIDTTGVTETMSALGLIAAESLSCEVAAVYIREPERLEVVDRGWTLARSREQVEAGLRLVLDEARAPYCVQDAHVVPLPAPLDGEAGIRSYYLLELTGVSRGVLLVAHTDAAPRGFTQLCRRLGLRLAEVASAKLGVALTREWCSAEAGRLHAEFAKLDVS